MPGGDDVGIEEGGLFVGEVEIAFASGGVVALKAMAGEDGLNVIDEERSAAIGGGLGFGRGEALFEERGDFGGGEGLGIDRDLVEGAEPGAVVREFVSEGEAVVAIPILEGAREGVLGGFVVVDKERGLAVAGASEDDVGGLGGESGGGEGGNAVGAGLFSAEAGVEFGAILAESDVSV